MTNITQTTMNLLWRPRSTLKNVLDLFILIDQDSNKNKYHSISVVHSDLGTL